MVLNKKTRSNISDILITLSVVALTLGALQSFNLFTFIDPEGLPERFLTGFISIGVILFVAGFWIKFINRRL